MVALAGSHQVGRSRRADPHPTRIMSTQVHSTNRVGAEAVTLLRWEAAADADLLISSHGAESSEIDTAATSSKMEKLPLVQVAGWWVVWGVRVNLENSTACQMIDANTSFLG